MNGCEKNPEKKNQNKILLYARQVMQSSNCVPTRLLKMLVNHSTDPLGAHWDGEIVNEKSMGIKHIQTCLNSDVSEMAKVL